MTDHRRDVAQDLPASRPLQQLDDDELIGELTHLLETRVDTLRQGSNAALAHSTERMEELEAEYIRRNPFREVSPDRLRPA